MEMYFIDCMNEKQLREKYRELVKAMHPDKNSDDPNATAKFQEMQNQYEERLAELHGDYSKSAKGRERRAQYEREQREREERERKEREQRKFEEVIKQARLNKGASFRKLKEGDYVYARKVNETQSMFEWDYLTTEELLRVVLKMGVADETVVRIDHILELSDDDIMEDSLSDKFYGIFGGWETIQQANPMGGVPKAKKVARVVLFRSQHYCMFGNPMGDMKTITDYYVPCNYGEMFSDRLHVIQADMERERIEKERKEQERKAKLLAEQKPLIDKWQDKLITVSAALSEKEKTTVAVENLRTMLKEKFPGMKLKISKYLKDNYFLRWQDGPTGKEVENITRLFAPDIYKEEHTPWEQQFGRAVVYVMERTMSTITKATILQELGEVTVAFSTSGYDDEVVVGDYDWIMLHLMAGVQIGDGSMLCKSYTGNDGTRKVVVGDAVQYIFNHTSYVKPKKTKKAKL